MKRVFLFVIAAILSFGAVNAQSEEVKIIPSASALKANNVEIEFRGCYGDSQSSMVYMVIAVKVSEDWNRVYAKHLLGVTAKGKSYQTCTSSSPFYEVIKDFPVEINMSKTALEGVPKEVSVFAAIKPQIANNEYTFTNVPIQWDVKPE